MIGLARLCVGLAAGLAAMGTSARGEMSPAPAGPTTGPVAAGLAPELTSAPRTRPPRPPGAASAAEAATEAEAREVARAAARAYSLARAAPVEAQATKFAVALALFDRLRVEHPTSAVARDVADGAIGLIDVNALRALAAPAASGATASQLQTTPVAEANPFADAIVRAAEAICAGADEPCADALAASASAWVASPAVLAALSEISTSENALAQLGAFRGLIEAEDFAAFETTAGAAPLAALVALDAIGSVHAPTTPAIAAVGVAEPGAGEAARLWSVSAVSLALLTNRLVADGVAEQEVHALARRADALHGALYASLARGEAAGALFGSEPPRRLSAVERRFLSELFSLTVDTQVALLGASGYLAASDRVIEFAQWLDASAVAVYRWRTALIEERDEDELGLR